MEKLIYVDQQESSRIYFMLQVEMKVKSFLGIIWSQLFPFYSFYYKLMPHLEKISHSFVQFGC